MSGSFATPGPGKRTSTHCIMQQRQSPPPLVVNARYAQLSSRVTRCRPPPNMTDAPPDNVPPRSSSPSEPLPPLPPFHLAIPVHDMSLARSFYGTLLALPEGRRCKDKWQDYSLFGHQLVCHYVGADFRNRDYYNPVDGDEVPVAHFGAVLTETQWMQLAQRLKENGVQFVIQPHKRFVGQPGEQYTMFFKDPSNNNLEFKCMTNPQNLFAKYEVQE